MPFNSWVDWSNGVKLLAQGNNNTTVAWLGIEPGTFQLPDRCPNHLAKLPHAHTHARMHRRTHTNTHIRTHVCTNMHVHTKSNTYIYNSCKENCSSSSMQLYNSNNIVTPKVLTTQILLKIASHFDHFK